MTFGTWFDFENEYFFFIRSNKIDRITWFLIFVSSVLNCWVASDTVKPRSSSAKSF